MTDEDRSATLPLVKIPAAQVRKILGLVEKGLTSGQIAEEIDVPLHVVTYVRGREGVPAPIGRPATGRRERCSARVDDDVSDQLDANATRDAVTRSDVVADVLTAWARGEELPTRSRK